MRLMTRLLLTASLLALPAAAHAQKFQVSPFAGVTFGGDTTRTSGTAGLSATWMAMDWLGVEGEIAHTPNLFEQDGFTINRSLTTFSGSLVVAVPGMDSGRLKPYAVVGLSSLMPHLAEAGDLSEREGSVLALSLGAGITAFVNDHVGIRGDMRYFRGIQDSDLDTNVFGVKFSEYSFVRTTLGLVVRF